MRQQRRTKKGTNNEGCPAVNAVINTKGKATKADHSWAGSNSRPTAQVRNTATAVEKELNKTAVKGSPFQVRIANDNRKTVINIAIIIRLVIYPGTIGRPRAVNLVITDQPFLLRATEYAARAIEAIFPIGGSLREVSITGREAPRTRPAIRPPAK